VLVHRFADYHSYLMPASGGSEDLGEGEQFESGSADTSIGCTSWPCSISTKAAALPPSE
jgi:hypothetical protein